jgi:hypothetical protein
MKSWGELKRKKAVLDTMHGELTNNFLIQAQKCKFRRSVYEGLGYSYNSCDNPRHEFHGGPPMYCTLGGCPRLKQ